MPAKKTAKKKKAAPAEKRPRGRPATGKIRTSPMPHIQPEYYDKLRCIAETNQRSIAKTAEYAIDLLHLQTFHM